MASCFTEMIAPPDKWGLRPFVGCATFNTLLHRVPQGPPRGSQQWLLDERPPSASVLGPYWSDGREA